MTPRIQVPLAAISGFVAVAAGAFGAHFLKARLAPDALQVFETGARYQMYHALALLAVACVTARALRRSGVPQAGCSWRVRWCSPVACTRWH
jgi:uncharacterized membrane protein YgdD (TMEM256/DUF423 family)